MGGQQLVGYPIAREGGARDKRIDCVVEAEPGEGIFKIAVALQLAPRSENLRPVTEVLVRCFRAGLAVLDALGPPGAERESVLSGNPVDTCPRAFRYRLLEVDHGAVARQTPQMTLPIGLSHVLCFCQCHEFFEHGAKRRQGNIDTAKKRLCHRRRCGLGDRPRCRHQPRQVLLERPAQKHLGGHIFETLALRDALGGGKFLVRQRLLAQLQQVPLRTF